MAMGAILEGSAIHAISQYLLLHSAEILFGVLVAWVLWSLFKIFIYPYYFSPLRHLPEPPHSARFPWYHAQAFRETPNGAALRSWSSIPNNGIIRIRVFMNRERIFITSPEALKEVLVTKSYDWIKPRQANTLFRMLLGDGVLVADGAHHKTQRKALLPAFSFRHIKDLYPLFWNKARKSGDAIGRALLSGQPVRAYDWASRTTLDIIGLAGMGWDFGSLDDPESKAVKTYKLLFDNEPPTFRWGYLGIPPLPQWSLNLPMPTLLRAREAALSVRSIAHEIVKNKKPGGYDILSVAMESQQFGEDELVDQMMTFLAAGHETTSSALTWAMYQFCVHPDIQRRLREEIRTGLPSEEVTADQIDSLRYLNAVCSEVLRCIPSVPTTHRISMKDDTIAGQFIPKGTHVYISPWATNMDNKLWGEDAHTFDPDRWLNANSGGAQTNYANLTFIHGPRSCIGKDFAKAELKCLVAAWIGRFEVSWAEDALNMEPIGYVTVKPGHGLPLRWKDLGDW